MTDIAGVAGGAQLPSTSYTNPDGLSIFGQGTVINPLTSSGGTRGYGPRSEKLAQAGVSFQYAAAYPIGTPVYPSAYNATTKVVTLTQAIASAIGTSGVVGLLGEASLAASQVAAEDVIDGGLVELTTAQWDAIVQGETGGLTTGDTYYLNAAGSQKPLVTAAPTGESDFVVCFGTALTPTLMRLNITPPIPVSI